MRVRGSSWMVVLGCVAMIAACDSGSTGTGEGGNASDIGGGGGIDGPDGSGGGGGGSTDTGGGGGGSTDTGGGGGGGGSTDTGGGGGSTDTGGGGGGGTTDTGGGGGGTTDTGGGGGGSTDTGGGGSTDTGSAYHPAGFDDPTVHGPEMTLGMQDCRTCHGDDLMGGSAGVSCDDCHNAGWRTTCTYCHGGIDNDTGAPPLGLDGTVENLAFPPHTKHVEETIHPAFDCTECHTKPVDVLSAGHVFDDTPGKAEVTFGTLNPAATYDAGTCASSYCHGNGRGDNGTSHIGDAATTCSSCHPNSSAGASKMSGKHAKHLSEGVKCQDCHGAVVTSPTQIANASLHVNGKKDVQMPSGITMTGNSCTGLCHGKGHFGKTW